MPGLGLIQPWHLLILLIIMITIVLAVLGFLAWLLAARAMRRPSGPAETRRSTPPLPREEI